MSIEVQREHTRAPTGWEYCGLCGCDEREPPVVTIIGKEWCGECGNKITLCRKHASELRAELAALDFLVPT